MFGGDRPTPKLPFKVKLMIAAHSFSVDTFSRSDLTVNRSLIGFFDPRVPASKNPRHGVITFDVTIDPARKLWFRLYVPSAASTTSLPLIVYFHGGGFAFSAANSKSYDEFCRRLAREVSAVIVSVNYRRSPEHRFPCPYEDGLDALKYIDGPNFGGLPGSANLKTCFLAGDSAGGNLAHHLTVMGAQYQFSKLQILGLLAIQPFFGGEERTESEKRIVGVPFISVERTDWLWKAFLPEGSNRNHPAAHVFGKDSVDIGVINFPAVMVVIGGFDPLQDWQRRYVEWLKSKGKDVKIMEYPNAIHGFYSFAELPESGMLISDFKDFARAQIAKSEAMVAQCSSFNTWV